MRCDGQSKTRRRDDLTGMDTVELNRPVFELSAQHPARRFLHSFIERKAVCVGRHLEFEDQVPIDLEWRSVSDGRLWTFSDFAYSYLSRDVVLDGLLEEKPYPTESEAEVLALLPLLRSMMNECRQTAERSSHSEILALTEQV